VKALEVEGDWYFCFRDYINEEELSAMASSRGAFTPLRLRGTTRLSVKRSGSENSNMQALLVDTFELLGVVPVRITWLGKLVCFGNNSSELQWDDTEMFIGWDGLGRTVKRPAPAERLRQQPWELRAQLNTDSKSNRILSLYRKSGGTLAYRKL